MRVPFDQIEHEEHTDARYEGRPFTGTAFAARDGVVHEECDFVSGRMDGVRRGFFPDGSPKWFEHYRGGRAHGPAQSFFADGRLQRSAVYDAGVLLREVEYGENGEKVSGYDAAAGVRTEWRLDGSLRKVTVYEPATEHWYRAPREERYYDADGQPTVVHTQVGWASAGRSADAT
jgi:antitoxin component YwqK of YwqJK toxin-antitoxin module